MDAREMYKEHILDLYKHPLNFGHLEYATHKERKHNPLCGDDITIELMIKDDKVEDVKFSGKGCAISMASASLLTDAIKGKTVSEVKEFTSEELIELLEIPIGPVRVKCALLSLEVAHKAIH
jgi:nitrogen fixation protein NifU and related proteins